MAAMKKLSLPSRLC